MKRGHHKMLTTLKSAVVLISLGLSGVANATPQLAQFLTDIGVYGYSGTGITGYGDISDYRVGDVWGKHHVFESDLPAKSRVYQRMAMATGYIQVGGTGFYLGQYNGANVVATNHHVCPTARDCVGQKIEFRLLHRVYKITKVYQSLANVDLALLEIDVPSADAPALKNIGKMFSVRKNTYRGEPLLTIGFGVGGNPQNYMMGTDDSDCKVFSGNGEYRHLADPDKYNPVGYRAWSFAHGCDISHGDSGSAMVDRNTGDIVGILWTGQIPKHKKYQKSANLDLLIKNPTSDVWTELNYAVTATKIGQYLYEQVQDNGALSGTVKSIYLKMLDAGSRE
ncbi:MAG: trypsin-like peptidase domain-containing protein [Bdellovibrionales bacterium]|nr:trypsin-like peptidase domain-containing protein [Bdellovibrionales bacterium]